MSYSLFSIRDLRSRMTEDELHSLLSSFKCSMEPEEEDYLMNMSVKHDIDGISRTYLFIENDANGYSIKGYFTLAIKCLSIKESKDIQDEMKDQMNIDRGVAQAYLLGQLAKADGAEREGSAKIC